MAADAMAADSIRLDRYILDTLMRDLVGHDRSASAFLAYLAIVAETGTGRAVLSHAALAERTGLSKRACQNAVAILSQRGLIEVTRRGATEAAQYRPLRPWAKPR